MAHDLQGESPLTTCQEEGLVKDNGVVARRGRKEVWNKARTRRTETAYEARRLDQAASALPALATVEASGHAV